VTRPRLSYHRKGNTLALLDDLGPLGQVAVVTDPAPGPEKLVTRLDVRPLREHALWLRVRLTNLGRTPLALRRVQVPRLRLAAEFLQPGQTWTMQAAAVAWGQDFAFPFDPNFERENFLGHVQNGEGGGIPVVYFWTPRHGLALMHIDPVPRPWYMPVRRGTVALEQRDVVLAPGVTFLAAEVVISVHRGDFFEPLALYRELMAARGLDIPEPHPAAFEAAWCSWGYEFDVRPEEVLRVLPLLEEMGIQWVTLDDRWFDFYGDWYPRPDTFPGGEDDMRRLTDAIHQRGMYAQIWWYPLAVEDGHGDWDARPHGVARLFREHPDWVVRNPDGSVARNNRHLAMLCPPILAFKSTPSNLPGGSLRIGDLTGTNWTMSTPWRPATIPRTDTPIPKTACARSRMYIAKFTTSPRLDDPTTSPKFALAVRRSLSACCQR